MEPQKGKRIVLVTASAAIIIMIVAGVMLANRSAHQPPASHDALFEHATWMQGQLDSIMKSDDFQATLQKLGAGGKLDPDSVAELHDSIARRLRDLAKDQSKFFDEKLLRALNDQLDLQRPVKVEEKITRIPIR